MNVNISIFAAFVFGTLASSMFHMLQPISSAEVHFKGLMAFAETLEGYGFEPRFDPRTCKTSDLLDRAAKDLGAYMYVNCVTTTDAGQFIMEVGYSRWGATVDGSQGLAAEQ